MRIIRYLASGLIGVAVNLGLYRLLVEYVLPDKILSSIIAVTISTVVGFCLQKYWTFKTRAPTQTHIQFALYVLVACINIALNTAIVFVLISFFATYYLLAQAIAAGMIAIWSFFVYRGLIFKVNGNMRPDGV
jgi:putative flippase GtrA